MNGSVFAIGFVAGQAAFCLLALTLGTLPFPNREKHPTLGALLVIAFGAALLVASVSVRRRRSEPARPRANPRTEAFRTRLSTLRPATALGTGAVLGVGGPKRLGITLVVAATITTAGLSDARETALAVLYVLVATVLVWVPVSLYVIFGHRAAEWLTSAQAWIGGRKDAFTFYPSAVLGAVLIVDGIVQLTT